MALCFFPDRWMSKTKGKLKQKLIKNYKEIKNTEYELIDRYGNYPDEIQNLFNLLNIKIKRNNDQN